MSIILLFVTQDLLDEYLLGACISAFMEVEGSEADQHHALILCVCRQCKCVLVALSRLCCECKKAARLVKAEEIEINGERKNKYASLKQTGRDE